MKKLTKILLLSGLTVFMLSCDKDDKIPVANNVQLHFENTFKNNTIILGDASSNTATVNTSAEGQTHRFSELKYVISNIRLIKDGGNEVPYNINDLDKGATVIDQSKPTTLDYVLRNIPTGTYKTIKFGLGINSALNTLDQVRFPVFYANAGANDTKMMWEWGTGYRFTKIEGFYGVENKQLSIHSGSTIEGNEGAYTQGVNAYREITLDLAVNAIVGKNSPKITIKADFDKLLSGKINTILLKSRVEDGNHNDDSNATPNVMSALQMTKFIDNLGGNGTSDITGMFSIHEVQN